VPSARSGLQRSGLLVLGVLAACVAVAAVDLPGRPQTLCLLRAATGVPCPLCGTTTAAVAVGSGRPLAALSASPLAVLAGAALVALPLVPAAARQRLTAHRTAVVLAALGLSQLWQLVRLT
jgi:hypothetical protein